ncbi:thiamine pyrophosphate-binding protein [Salibacterium salarium]|uniref:Thiamine pyrophosphate-binding protein n=1 Tax=Salibacterium salarium TaxID=284579 RepID=A0A428N1N2_9BACI|nr:thiamine pyrophosphate-binding protein [Salibacterium salarium]RSL32162.1 thiamine pyrophosphate-binding protein [Salibacterium salarium]
MTKKYVSEQLVDYLEYNNVENIFGLCGHTNIAVLAALENSSVNFIDVRHEQIAAHAADGYARVKKETSVVLSHLGPGLTNAATGVANASLDSIPMVVIAGDVPSHYYGKHPHQEVNLHADASQYEIYKPFVKRAWRVDRPDLFPEIIDKAFSLAQSGRPGPVLVSVPMDIFSTEIDTELFDRVKQNNKNLTKPSISDAKARQVIERLLDAENPVFYVGGGIMLADAADELRELVDHLGIPVAYSLMGKGAVSDEHPLTLGMTGFWGTKFINDTCRDADLILALGTRFSEADSSSWYPEYTFNIPETKLIHIDIDSKELGRNYPVDLGIVADIKEALTELTRVAKEMVPKGRKNNKMEEAIASYREEFFGKIQKNQKSDAFPLRPERILGDVRAALPEDAYITTDVGWNKNGVGQQFPAYKAGTILTPGGYATMGFGSSAALGAKLADPGRIVVSMIGDGGFGQNPSVMATAVSENIPVIWVVMNNSSYGTIAGLEKSHFDTTYGTVFQRDGKSYSPDFAQIAKGYGVDSVKITKAEEFKPALEEAIQSNKPFLLDVSMLNEPVPTDGHWNIMDIYSPGKNVTHSSV